MYIRFKISCILQSDLRLLRIAALHSVAKVKTPVKKGEATTKPAADPILDASSLTSDTIVNEVTKLPDKQEVNLVEETPSAKLKRKRKWQQLSERLKFGSCEQTENALESETVFSHGEC